MTLRLVPKDNVAPIPVGNLQDIAGMARRFADQLDAAEFGDVIRSVVIAQRDDGSLTIFGWGENSSAYELMGIFEAAKLRVFADDLIED